VIGEVSLDCVRSVGKRPLRVPERVANAGKTKKLSICEHFLLLLKFGTTLLNLYFFLTSHLFKLFFFNRCEYFDFRFSFCFIKYITKMI